MQSDASRHSVPVRPRSADICAAAFWRALAPDLHVGDLARLETTRSQQPISLLQRRMERDGYFADCDDQLQTLTPALGQAVEQCVAMGLPPVFVWAFDEPWECFRIIAPVISHFLGAEHKLLPAFWAWHVDPAKGERGWRPHRDNSRSLAADGSPLTLTCWIPLSEANPQNSCMYVVPAHLDPHYGRPTTLQSQLPDLSLARALPARPGDYLIWNQVVLHWGSASSEFADKPRMSIALEFQRGDIPPIRGPLLDAQAPPSFEQRIRLIAQQILQYTHMYQWSSEILSLATELQSAPIDPA